MTFGRTVSNPRSHTLAAAVRLSKSEPPRSTYDLRAAMDFGVRPMSDPEGTTSECHQTTSYERRNSSEVGKRSNRMRFACTRFAETRCFQAAVCSPGRGSGPDMQKPTRIIGASMSSCNCVQKAHSKPTGPSVFGCRNGMRSSPPVSTERGERPTGEESSA